MDEMITAGGLFEAAMAWLTETYTSHRFFQERDIVWTLHLHLLRTINERHLPYSTFSGYRMYVDRQRSADLVILSSAALVEVAVEFKYEPDRLRTDLLAPGAIAKGPVVSWNEIEKDVIRARQFVAEGRARSAYAVFLDEGGYFRRRTPPVGAEWRDWLFSVSSHRVLSILWSRADDRARPQAMQADASW